MKTPQERLQKDLTDYVKAMHTQEECAGFIDGYEQACRYYPFEFICIGIVIGVAISIFSFFVLISFLIN
jgi:hypothetical protein